MKKIISLTIGALTLLSTFSLSASAVGEDNLPFKLSAPENVSVEFLDGRDSPNTCEIHYSQNKSMSEWFTRWTGENEKVKAELQSAGYEDILIKSQIDWSIDSQDDWHCNKYWETDGCDENMVQKVGEWAYYDAAYSEEISMSEWIFRGFGDINDPEDKTWYGDHRDADYDGWKDVLKDGQYDVVKDGGNSYAVIDLSKHTIYTRVRWLVSVTKTGSEEYTRITSDWSQTAAVGKDARKSEAIKPGEIAAPAVKDLRVTKEEGSQYPQVTFRLDVDDKLSAQLAQATGTQGVIRLETEARVMGKENWTALQGDFTIKSGDMKADLQALAQAEGEISKDTPIEFRARYYCSQTDQEDFYSDYSEILSFGTEKMKSEENSLTGSSAEEISEVNTDGANAPDEQVQQEKQPEEKKCSVCGFCPQPFGLCIFIWIAIAVVVVIAVVVTVVVIKKKKSGQSKDK